MKRALIPVIRRTKFVWKECRVGKVSFLFFLGKIESPIDRHVLTRMIFRLIGSQQTSRWSGPREPKGLDRSKSAADSRAEGGARCESCGETSSETHCSEGASKGYA